MPVITAEQTVNVTCFSKWLSPTMWLMLSRWQAPRAHVARAPRTCLCADVWMALRVLVLRWGPRGLRGLLGGVQDSQVGAECGDNRENRVPC